MAEGRDLVHEALQDAKSLKEAAVESAKNELVEALAPAVRRLLDESVRGALSERSRAPEFKGKEGGTKQQKKDYDPDGSVTPELHEEEDPELALETALQELFPGENGVKENTKMAESKTKKDGKSEKKEAATCETVEISNEELRKVYEASVQTEVAVKKGFSDIVGGGEIEQAAKETGILDKVGGEKQFDQEEPPHKQKWIPENMQKIKGMLEAGLAENKKLREVNRKALAMVETLGKELHKVNLFNAKVMHVNKILNGGARLTREQKSYVMESIDKARSISEVKMVYETIVGGFKTTTTALTESRVARPPKANAQAGRPTGASSHQRVLSESADRAPKANPEIERIRQLAGLTGGKK